MKNIIIPKWLKDTFVEGLRLLIFGIIGYLASGGQMNIGIILTITLRVADKLMHKYGKEEEVDWMVTGLTRF